MKKKLIALMATLALGSSLAQMPYPKGNFRDTCRDWNIVGTTLNATCWNYEDQWARRREVTSSLKHYDMCDNIQNNNGRLQCGAVKACTKLGSDGSGPRNGPCCGKRLESVC